MDKHILHCDMDNFFASVSCLGHPEYAGKGVVVCGENRHGIVLAKNAIAKASGIATGEPIHIAEAKSPGLIKLFPEYEKYVAYSRMIRRIYEDYTGNVEPFSIDECWLDVTTYGKDFPFALKTAKDIQLRVLRETGLCVSIGAAWNKIYAKLSSDLAKPSGIFYVTREDYREKLFSLPARSLMFVGRRVEKRLKDVGIFTIGDIASAPDELLVSLFGKNGITLALFARGEENGAVKGMEEQLQNKGIGNSVTMQTDMVTIADIRNVMLGLCESVAMRLMKKQLAGRIIGISMKDSATKQVTVRQHRLSMAVMSSDDLIENAMELIQVHWDGRPLRAVGVSLSGLASFEQGRQLSLFCGEQLKNERLEQAKLAIRDKYGLNSISRLSTKSEDVGERVTSFFKP